VPVQVRPWAPYKEVVATRLLDQMP
jgi:hypothetical protein